MKVVRSFGMFLIASGLVACARTSDLDTLRDEAQGVVDRAKPEVAELDHRVAFFELKSKVFEGAPDFAAAKLTVDSARAKLATLKGELARKPAQIAEAAKGPKTDELYQIIDETREHVRDELTGANAEITTGEMWLARNEQAAAQRAATPPPPPPPPAPVTGETNDGPPTPVR